MRRRASTRWGLAAALAALAACVVSPIAVPASFSITPDGPPVTVTVSTSGGTSTASFNGNAGQRISLSLSGVTITSSKISILKPGGANLVTPFTVTRTGFFFDVHALPTTGVYKIVVDPKDTYTGKVVLTLYNVPPDPTAPIVAGGAAVPATTTAPGQNALFTFSGLTGHKISVEVSSVALSSGNGKIRVLKPDGTALYPTAPIFGSAGGFLEPKLLPVDGTYTIVADPQLKATGSFSVSLFDVPADPSVALTPNGASAPATTTVPGQNAAFTFTAVAGVRYSVKLSDSTFDSAKVSWRKPDGTDLFSPSLAINPLGTFLSPRTLTPAGTYTLFIDPQLAATGTVTAQVFTVPADLTGPIAVNTPLHVAIASPGQNALYAFTGVLNHRMSLNLTNNTFERVSISILKPDGTALFSPALQVLSSDGFKDPVKLPVGGTYKVKVDPVDDATGAIDVGLYDVTADASAAITPTGTPVTVSTTSPGQNASLTFTIAAAKRVSLNVTGVTMANAATSGLSLKILRPDGTTLKSTTLGTNGTFVDTQSLTTTGTYKIQLDPAGAQTGSATVTLYTVPADVTAAILTNGTATTIANTTPGQSAALTFSASANQRVFLKVTGATTATPPKVSLQRVGTSPIQYVFFTQTVNTDPYYFDTKSVGATAGSFKVVFDPQGADVGAATFKLWAVPADVSGTITPGSNTVTVGNVGQVARVTFAGTTGQTATLTFSSATLSEAWVKLYDTNGTTQLSSAYWVSSLSSNDTVTKLLPHTGNYTVLIDPTNEFTGGETFTLTLS